MTRLERLKALRDQHYEMTPEGRQQATFRYMRERGLSTMVGPVMSRSEAEREDSQGQFSSFCVQLLDILIVDAEDGR